jgi:hypothetical protein
MADQSPLNGRHARRIFLQALGITGLSAAVTLAQQPGRQDLKEPVFRVSKNTGSQPGVAQKTDSHPLDPALELARNTLTMIQRDLVDYTAMIVKRERVGGKLGVHEFMEAKIRNRKIVDGKQVTPLSVYMKFVKPEAVKGREVIWVEGKNNNKLRAHEGGTAGSFLPTVWLPPDGILAMRGQLHPITDIGLENMVLKLIEKGERERKFGECEVEFKQGAKINGRSCTVLQVKHPTQRPHFEFHTAQIFIDDENKMPVRYAAYHWPTDPADKLGPVLEEYTYLDLKLNPGLVDADFDSENPNYNF